MLYPVLIQERADGKYEASVPLIPGLVRAGETRDDTLQEIKHAISESLSRGELVFVDVPLPGLADTSSKDNDHASNALIGLFDLGDPNLAENAEQILQASTSYGSK